MERVRVGFKEFSFDSSFNGYERPVRSALSGGSCSSKSKDKSSLIEVKLSEADGYSNRCESPVQTCLGLMGGQQHR